MKGNNISYVVINNKVVICFVLSHMFVVAFLFDIPLLLILSMSCGHITLNYIFAYVVLI